MVWKLGKLFVYSIVMCLSIKVTMEWWTDLWLNEGFASWIEYLCVDNCHPEYEIWTQFLSQDYSHGLGLDALSNSHPIEVHVT